MRSRDSREVRSRAGSASAAAEAAQPVVGRPTVWGRIRPDIPIAPAARSRGSAVGEPGVPVRRMVGNEIEKQLDVAFVQTFDQAVEVVETAEGWIDGAVIG